MADLSEKSPLLAEEPTPRVDIAGSGHRHSRCSCSTGSRTAAVVLVLVTVAASVAVAVIFTRGAPATSVSEYYKSAAVISDQKECSQIGSDIMRVRNGSAVDAAVATVLCIGVTGAQASGIGGGHFMVIYDTPKDGSKKEVVTINAREVAPTAAFRDMFNGTDGSRGGLAVAVPGEVRGLFEAWSRFGRLPWKELVQQTINLCENGFRVSEILARRMESQAGRLEKFPGLRNLLTKPDGSSYNSGDIMKRPLLAKTLRHLADEGPESFYTGRLADDIIHDLQDAGGIITSDDLRNYKARVEPALHVPLANQTLDLYVPSLPSGGPVLQFILRVLQGFTFHDTTTDNTKRNVDFFQALAETFKFAFALRSHLGDDTFVDMSEVMSNLTSESFGKWVRSRIDLVYTHDLEYYGSAYLPQEDHGTAHVSVVAPDGAAVAVTTSVNTYFGSKVYGSRTGIIFNSEMDDFSTPNSKNAWGIRPSAANFIEGGKRPLSSMTPTIVLDHVTKKPRLVIGGAGGSHITTMVGLVSHLNLMFGVDLQPAIDFPRVHHQLLPNIAEYEPDVNKDVVTGLHRRGHSVTEVSFLAVVNGISRKCDAGNTCYLTAVGDRRRGGVPAGWN